MTVNSLLTFLGAFGIILSSYMTWIFVRVQRGEEVKCFDDVCPIVMKTTYAQSLGFPNSYLAIPFYIIVTVFGALEVETERRPPTASPHSAGEFLYLPVLAASLLSVAMSVYLVYALLVKLKRN